MEFRLLGPLAVIADDGGPVALPANKHRVLLAGLLLRADRWVPVEQLADWLWDGEGAAPVRVRGTVQTYVSRLRRLLGDPAVITGGPGGYRAEVGTAGLDVRRFTGLADRAGLAADAGDWPDAERLSAAALGLWREPRALPDVDSAALHREEVALLEERRLAALERWYEARIRLGDHLDAAHGLRRLCADHPLRERCWELLLTALAGCGRRADAIAAYAAVTATLDEELGVAPGPGLQRAHLAVLRAEPSPSWTAAEAPGRSLTPDRLPARPAFLAGRAAELRDLTRAVRTGCPVAVVHGPAGVGKSALVADWAHLAADRFPGGRVCVDLAGHDGRLPAEPADVLAGVLLALGVPDDLLPADPAGLAALFRAETARRRVLLLLDDARDSAQVRPLIPAAGSLTLVTSRNQLRGLAAHDGAHRVRLGPLDAPGAGALLAAVLGERRVAPDPAAAAELARLCGGLPLALRIAAERAGRHPDVPLDLLAAELRDERTRLAVLDAGEEELSSLSAQFGRSYRSLDADEARAFRLLGGHPGPVLELSDAVELIGAPAAPARRLLDRLVGRHLVDEPRPGRYEVHPLLRLYALECEPSAI
ncbi:BTAD domain-containing putative transcriptional regulator [Kitasatospora sp. NPDC056446]|uniref:AfsR/SARP family transcriptional regulator n=1 Tax=Kitasatospora sp. NPDC056446 TaxID=3345819 RepID=UPI0036CC110E